MMAFVTLSGVEGALPVLFSLIPRQHFFVTLPAWRFNHFAAFEIILLPFMQKEERPVGGCGYFPAVFYVLFAAAYDGVIVINGHVRSAHHFKRIFLYHNGSGFVQTDADELGGVADEFDKIELAVAAEKVLVDDGVFEET